MEPNSDNQLDVEIYEHDRVMLKVYHNPFNNKSFILQAGTSVTYLSEKDLDSIGIILETRRRNDMDCGPNIIFWLVTLAVVVVIVLLLIGVAT